MIRNCRQCDVSFEITDDDLQFYEKVSPVFQGKKYVIPPPTLCPECRQQRRLCRCNEYHLYSGRCSFCNKEMITEYSPEKIYPIYCRDCYYSDKWDPLVYGKEFNKTKSFFEQFLELQKNVPCRNLAIDGININCDYIHYSGSSKNCYLIQHSDFCEDCYYGYGFKKNKSCVDGFYILHSELCYDCVDCHKCYDLKGCQDCLNCYSSSFLHDCIGCQNCFLCFGLRQKSYCYKNKQFSKEEYNELLKNIKTGSYKEYQQYKKELKELKKQIPCKEMKGNNVENCTGNYLYNCQDVLKSYDCENVETAKYCYQVVLGAKDIYDIYQFGTNLQQSYECAIVGENSYHLLFCFMIVQNGVDLLYCSGLESCSNCFGCINLKHKQYCIFNKQYTKEEYEELVPKIIEHMRRTPLLTPLAPLDRGEQKSPLVPLTKGDIKDFPSPPVKGDLGGYEWGEFFPASISPFAYNETVANEYYPLTREQALGTSDASNSVGNRHAYSLQHGQIFNWSDYEPPKPDVKKIIPAEKLPDDIKKIPDDILNWAIECEVTKKPFRIIKQELEFYRQHNLPIPRRHPDQRHKDRLALRNPRKLWKRNCMNCNKEIQTTYAPDRPEIVYCEECYLKEIY